jgi:hypothetical protein
MPKSIPVQVTEHQFPSLNQARIFFTDILHRYTAGERVSAEDQQKISGLMTSSRSPYPTDNTQICVTKGFYGRMCFASVGADSQPHYVSIIQSLKRCVATSEPMEVQELNGKDVGASVQELGRNFKKK